MIFVAVADFRRVVGVVDLRVADAVEAVHNVHIHLQIEQRVAPNWRIAKEF